MEQNDRQQPVNPDSSNPPPPPSESIRAGAPDSVVPYTGPGDPPADESSLTVRQWLIQNAFTLAVLIAVVVLLFMKFDLDGLISIGIAALGLSFVIFIHELGHFAVAKWCDVHVTTFSIGFGPALPGCSFKRGETTYKLALFPLGGYVQMVGQVDGDETSDGSENDPRSYRNKSVGQRMAIISAGVIMNVILALICFVIVFRGPGKERKSAIVASAESGAPAYELGLSAGSEIKKIGSVENPYFEYLMMEVMSSRKDEALDIVWVDARGQKHTAKITPRKKDTDDRPYLGISPPDRPVLESLRRLRALDLKNPVWPNTPAAAASPAFEFGDRILATTDPDNPAKITDLKPDPRYQEGDQRDQFDLLRRLQDLAGKDMTFRVARADKDGKESNLEIKVGPAYHLSLGVRMHMGHIAALRKDSAAAQAKIEVHHATDKGDRIVGVAFERFDPTTKTFSTVTYDDKNLDPMRLPYQLRQAMADLPDEKKLVTLTLSRSPKTSGPDNPSVVVKLKWDDAWKYDRVFPSSPTSPLAIPELGLAYLVKNTVAGPDTIAPIANNQLQPWDEVKEVRLTAIDLKGNEKEGSWVPLKSDAQWASIFTNLSAQAYQIKQISLKVERHKQSDKQSVKEEVVVDVTPELDKKWPIPERGLILAADVRIQKADNNIDAMVLGLKDTHNNMLQVFLTLRGMFTGRLSPNLLGGPLTIANVAYRFAGYDFGEFVFFLGMISVNLAVINFLPIPVLDGGHMVFLIYEKLRGKPASENVRAGATYVGLALILCLMVFVLYLDVSRLFL